MNTSSMIADGAALGLEIVEQPGLISVRFPEVSDESEFIEMVCVLHRMVDRAPVYSEWVVDVSVAGRMPMPFITMLLDTAQRLHERGGIMHVIGLPEKNPDWEAVPLRAQKHPRAASRNRKSS
jgi:hypothetical protein